LAKILTAEQKMALQEMRPGGGGWGFGPPGGGPGGFGPPGGFGGGFGAIRLDDVKRQIGATDEEWKVIGPKLQKVLATRQVLAPDLRGGDPGGRPGGFGGPTAANIILQAQGELKAVLKDPKHTKTEVEEKVAGVRKARQKVRGDLDAAQKDLLQLLTAEQEAVLVSLGLLE
jgi:hypothetical protein